MDIYSCSNKEVGPVRLQESYREGKKVRKRTLANLSALSDEQLMAIRAILQGRQLRPVGTLFEVIGSRPQGHVEAVRVAMSKLGFQALLAARPCRERDLVADDDAGRGFPGRRCRRR